MHDKAARRTYIIEIRTTHTNDSQIKICKNQTSVHKPINNQKRQYIRLDTLTNNMK